MNKEKISFWKELIEERKVSTLKLNEWCQANKVTKHAYYYWRQKIEDMEAASDDASPVFAEVTSLNATTPAQPNVLITWKDISVHISDRSSAELAVEFITQLLRQC